MRLTKLGIGLCLLAMSLTSHASVFRSSSPPREGVDYHLVSQPEASPGQNAGKIEVLEFFYFGCQACRRMDPVIRSWASEHKGAVSLRRVPVIFSSILAPHMALYSALEALGVADVCTPRIFEEVQDRRNYLVLPETQKRFVSGYGVPAQRFEQAVTSDATKKAVESNIRLARHYQIGAWTR
ncbi:hypothetical protein [Burkholderia multivorans]|uniref:hypothetical protein n=1 Tax=Burkholderia multivorans TaxID=87883 RepID=UPI001C26814A|nr:hypothetical protein [Burkholderia multivorans]MBU9337248.1 hypothetical protein [Burkholderia multivorans]MCA8480117.1 hypothetical protein [Burkholderia multivorans]